MTSIEPHEMDIVGKWILSQGQLIVFVGLFLTASLLEKLAALLNPTATRETDRNTGGCG